MTFSRRCLLRSFIRRRALNHSSSFYSSLVRELEVAAAEAVAVEQGSGSGEDLTVAHCGSRVEAVAGAEAERAMEVVARFSGGQGSGSGAILAAQQAPCLEVVIDWAFVQGRRVWAGMAKKLVEQPLEMSRVQGLVWRRWWRWTRVQGLERTQVWMKHRVRRLVCWRW